MEQLGNENSPFWFDEQTGRLENNRMWIKNRVVCCHHGDHETHFITTKDLLAFFNGYGSSKQGLTAFVSGQFVWRAPNASMTRFKFDPFTGERIDWDAIKRFYRDYLEKE